METCVSFDLIGNTLHEVAPCEQITFFAVGAAHDIESTPTDFATLDYVLLPRVLQQYVGPSGVMSAQHWPAITFLLKQR